MSVRSDLPFEHSQLVTEGEDFGAEPGVWPAVDDEDLKQESDDGVGEGEEHDGRIAEADLAMPEGRSPGTQPSRRT